MKVKKKELQIEAVQFTGDNFDEVKALVPQVEKYTVRGSKLNQEQTIKGFEYKGYTVGWKLNDPTFGESFTEALPGFYIVKETIDADTVEFTILEPKEFKKLYATV